jgi:hypothetical protein
MKHHVGLTGFVLLLIVGSAPGQQATDLPRPPRPSARSSYDPMAQGNIGKAPKGIVETTLAGINPSGKDYGQAVADWRKEVFENTLERLYFWGLLLLGAGFGMSLAGNGWLLRDRERRLAISADVVTQLYNAYVGSRAKATEVVAKYNRLVDRYNSLDGAMSALKTATSAETAAAPGAPSEFEQAKKEKPGERRGSLNEQTDVSGIPGSEEKAADTESDLRGKVQELETKLHRKEAQLQAKENQITNLRSRLTRAHDSLEGERKQQAGAL